MISTTKIIEQQDFKTDPILTDKVISINKSWANIYVYSGMSDKPSRQSANTDTDMKLKEKEAELARMQAMLLQMQAQLKNQQQGTPSSSSHNV